MRGLLAIVAAFCLFAGLANGAIAHAVELTAHEDVGAAGSWQHFNGDSDEVPADSDKNYPHHHNMCHGHELATPLKSCAVAIVPDRAPALTAGPGRALTSASPARALRPPIA